MVFATFLHAGRRRLSLVHLIIIAIIFIYSYTDSDAHSVDSVFDCNPSIILKVVLKIFDNFFVFDLTVIFDNCIFQEFCLKISTYSISSHLNSATTLLSFRIIYNLKVII